MKTILLVEDEDLLRDLIRELLEIKGYSVLEASQGVAALERLQEHGTGIDLILTDVVMPQMSGSELVATLQVDYPAVKVIFMSGFTGMDDSAIQKSLQQPGVAFLQKPFRLSVLIELVHKLFGPDGD